jgi:type IV pilus assembly protein PilF
MSRVANRPVAVARPLLMLLGALLLGGCQSSSPQKPNAASEERLKVAALNTQLGVEYMKDGDNELALKKLEKAIETDPNYADAHNAMGLLRNRLQQFDQADASFREALRSSPDNPMALNNYGQFLCQQERFEEGQAKFMEAVKNPLYRTPEVALTNAGLCAMQAKDMTTAEEYFRAALAKNPRIGLPLLQMAQISHERGALQEAQRYLTRYLEVAPQSPRSLALGIRIEKALGNDDKAASYAVMLRNRFPDARETGQLLRGELN